MRLAPDTTPPAVVSPSRTQEPRASPARLVTATFNEPMDRPRSPPPRSSCADPSNALVAASVSSYAADRKVTLDAEWTAADLDHLHGHDQGGPQRGHGHGGNPLADDTWTFTTAAPPPPPPDEGPGGPILVDREPANPFSRYYAEILRAEGLNVFTVTDSSNVTPGGAERLRRRHPRRMPLSGRAGHHAQRLGAAGGNLIAMRPDTQLAGLLGLTRRGATLANGYLLVNTARGPGAGIVGQTIQFHGTADRYTLAGAGIATLFCDATHRDRRIRR